MRANCFSGFVGLAASIALSGCSGSQLGPPPMPTVDQIRAQQSLTVGIPSDQVRDFYMTGLLVAQMNCGGYFDLAVMSALRNARSAGEAQVLSGLALGIMGLTGVGGPAVAGAGLGTNFIGNLLSNQQENSLAGTDPAGMSTLISAAQGALIGAQREPTTAADALTAIYSVYRVCSPAGIQALKNQAIATAPSRLSVSPDPAPAALRGVAAPPTERRILPTIRVN